MSIFRQSQGNRVLANRLVKRFRGKRRSFSFDSRGRLGDGLYFARFRMATPSGRTDYRRSALQVRNGRFGKRPEFYRRASCGLLTSYKLSSAAFGGRGAKRLGIAFRLLRRGTVSATVMRGAPGRQALQGPDLQGQPGQAAVRRGARPAARGLQGPPHGPPGRAAGHLRARGAAAVACRAMSTETSSVETEQAAREASGAHPYGRYLEEFEVGAVYKHWPAKTVTEADDHMFCLITMNHHPLHINDVYAKASQQGRNVVVGPLVYSLALGMSVSDVSGKAIANLATEELKHPAPVFHGDTLFVESEVLEKRESKSKQDRGTVKVHTRVHNQDGVLVAEFKRLVLVPRREHGATPAEGDVE